MNQATATAPERVDTLIGQVAAEAPRAVAVEDGETSLTYGELWLRSGRVARGIRTSGPESTLIPVVGQRGADWVVACLAIMRAGCAFVPIDPGNPPWRRAAMIADLGADLVVRAGAPADGSPGSTRLDDLISMAPVDSTVHDAEAGPVGLAGLDEAAYGVFTSGSTGRPKLVVVPHRGLAHLARWHCRAYAVSRSTRVLQTASLGFDASVWELWPNLAGGATVVVASDDDRMVPSRLVERARLARVDLLFTPTPIAEMLMTLVPDRDVPWRTLLTGGDVLHIDRVPRGWTLVNHYGPTEATVVATAWTVDRVPPDGRAPIGRPISATTARVVDSNLRAVESGNEGELILGGPLIAHGYQGLRELTTAKFVSAAELPGRWYRTGDRVREGAQGFEFRGRFDDQVKVHGVRLEPGEVEAALLAHPGVRQAACCVIDTPVGGSALGAVIVTDDAAVTSREVRRFLASRLPAALIPTRVAVVEALPVTTRGKVDRAGLREHLTASSKE